MDKEKQKELFNEITSNPKLYILKHQKNNNNYYDDKILSLIPKDDSEPNDELLNSIIMEKIDSPEYESLTLINEKINNCKIISEFSVFGVIISSDNKTYSINKNVGFLVRSKDKNQCDGGIINEDCCIDLPCLIDVNVNKDDGNPISYNF